MNCKPKGNHTTVKNSYKHVVFVITDRRLGEEMQAKDAGSVSAPRTADTATFNTSMHPKLIMQSNCKSSACIITITAITAVHLDRPQHLQDTGKCTFPALARHHSAALILNVAAMMARKKTKMHT